MAKKPCENCGNPAKKRLQKGLCETCWEGAEQTAEENQDNWDEQRIKVFGHTKECTYHENTTRCDCGFLQEVSEKEENMGRKLTYNVEMATILCTHIANGLTQQDAFELEGVAKSTFYAWKAIYQDFQDAIKKAEIMFKQMHVSNVNRAAIKTWQASAWILERKFKSEFSTRNELTGADGEPLALGDRAKELAGKYEDIADDSQDDDE